MPPPPHLGKININIIYIFNKYLIFILYIIKYIIFYINIYKYKLN